MPSNDLDNHSVNGYVIHISQAALWWSAAAVVVPSACALGWWCIEKLLNKLAPYEVSQPRTPGPTWQDW